MRRKFLRLQTSILPGLLRGGFESTEPIPADLRVADVIWENWTNTIRIDVESSSFDPVPEDVASPEWNPSFREIN